MEMPKVQQRADDTFLHSRRSLTRVGIFAKRLANRPTIPDEDITNVPEYHGQSDKRKVQEF